jgi:hypothetical protein
VADPTRYTCPVIANRVRCNFVVGIIGGLIWITSSEKVDHIPEIAPETIE